MVALPSAANIRASEFVVVLKPVASVLVEVLLFTHCTALSTNDCISGYFRIGRRQKRRSRTCGCRKSQKSRRNVAFHSCCYLHSSLPAQL